MANLLWDAEKEEITGVIDFEWAHSAGPADEWFYSFGFEGGTYGGRTNRLIDPPRKTVPYFDLRY